MHSPGFSARCCKKLSKEVEGYKTNPNEVLPSKDADKEEDGRDEPGQDDHHNHLVDHDDGYEDNGHDKDLVSCAPCSIPGGQLHRTKPVKGNLI